MLRTAALDGSPDIMKGEEFARQGRTHTGESNRVIRDWRPVWELEEIQWEISYQLNFVALVRKRTIPAERPQPAGEVSANFCG
jgi:hypothetical protein